ncbi:hypothetical protein HmCmsJML025_01081 [Escherichia coli]|nr:hypothetical protein HmCmsJML025_01081 [Escherichia coli]
MTFDQIIQLFLHFRFTQIHNRFTVRFLITGRDYTIYGERVLLRRGHLFFQQATNHAGFQGGQLIFHEILLSGRASSLG